jgi:undecaprenyl-diphosphatase
LRTVVMMAVLGLAFYVLLPQLGDFETSVDAIKDADVAWIIAALVASALTYVAAAIQLQGSSPARLELFHTIELGLASSFTNRITPAGIGGVATNVRYLQRNGLDVAVAGSAYALNAAVSAVVHTSSLFVAAIIVGQRGSRAVPLPKGWELLVIIAVGLAVVGLIVLLPTIRKRVIPSLRSVGSSLRQVVTQPSRLVRLFGGAIGNITFYIASFALSLRAVGVHLPISEVIFVWLGGAVVSSVAPTPGGLGAMEAALTAGLTAFGAPPGPALAGVLTFRLLTYWAPILPGWLSFRRLRKLELL